MKISGSTDKGYWMVKANLGPQNPTHKTTWSEKWR